MGKHRLKVILSEDDKRKFDEVRAELSERVSLKLSNADVLRLLIREEHQRNSTSLPAVATG